MLYCNYADVAELVDALDLGSSFARSGGSSPFIRILHGIVDIRFQDIVDIRFQDIVKGIPLSCTFKFNKKGTAFFVQDSIGVKDFASSPKQISNISV